MANNHASVEWLGYQHERWHQIKVKSAEQIKHLWIYPGQQSGFQESYGART